MWIDYPREKATLQSVCAQKSVDFCRVMIHGVGGEDGEVQKILELHGMPFQTAASDVMHLTMDKYLTKLERKKTGLPLARSLIIDSFVEDAGDVHRDILEKITYPCIAKDTREGSSFGITILRSRDDLKTRRQEKDPTRQYLIETFLTGKEITISVRDTLDGGVEALPPIWVQHGQEVWDSTSKYSAETVNFERCPAPLPPEELATYEALAIKAYQAVGMTQYGRVDMIVTDDGPVLLEINTIPGFTPTSLFPRSAKVAGYTFPQVLQRLMDTQMQS